jgi:hypothetical protein
MSAQKEKNIDDLIAEYDTYRLMHPKLGLTEVSTENREFLIASRKSAGGLDAGFTYPKELFPDECYVFFGWWDGSCLRRDQSLRNTTWFKSTLKGDYKNIDFAGTRFFDCQLVNIDLAHSNLTDVTFENCTFMREVMSGAVFENVKVIRPIFKNYDPIVDYLDQVKLGFKSRLFDWSKLRILSEIPMFSISWSTLLGSLAIMNTIGWGSSNRDKLSSVVEPLSMPPTIIELFVAACFLATAATLYAVFCPPRIKEISETEWTDKSNKPRLQYFSHRFPYRWRERVAIVTIYVFGVIGLALMGKLVTERVVSAYCFTTNWEAPEQCKAPQKLQ